MIITLNGIIIIIGCARKYKEPIAKGLRFFADKQEYFSFNWKKQELRGEKRKRPRERAFVEEGQTCLEVDGSRQPEAAAFFN